MEPQLSSGCVNAIFAVLILMACWTTNPVRSRSMNGTSSLTTPCRGTVEVSLCLPDSSNGHSGDESYAFRAQPTCSSRNGLMPESMQLKRLKLFGKNMRKMSMASACSARLAREFQLELGMRFKVDIDPPAAANVCSSAMQDDELMSGAADLDLAGHALPVYIRSAVNPKLYLGPAEEAVECKDGDYRFDIRRVCKPAQFSKRAWSLCAWFPAARAHAPAGCQGFAKQNNTILVTTTNDGTSVSENILLLTLSSKSESDELSFYGWSDRVDIIRYMKCGEEPKCVIKNRIQLSVLKLGL